MVFRFLEACDPGARDEGDEGLRVPVGRVEQRNRKPKVRTRSRRSASQDVKMWMVARARAGRVGKWRTEEGWGPSVMKPAALRKV